MKDSNQPLPEGKQALNESNHPLKDALQAMNEGKQVSKESNQAPKDALHAMNEGKQVLNAGLHPSAVTLHPWFRPSQARFYPARSSRPASDGFVGSGFRPQIQGDAI